MKSTSLDSFEFMTQELEKTTTQLMLETSETQQFKVNNLRNKRKQIQQKIKLISNRINFRHKKQEQSLKKCILSQDKSRTLSLNRKNKRLQQLITSEIKQKKNFETIKKAQQIQKTRNQNIIKMAITHSALTQKKHEQGEKIRFRKKIEKQARIIAQRQRIQQIQQKKQEMNHDQQYRQQKRKKLVLERKNVFERLMDKETDEYEKLLKTYMKKTTNLRQQKDKLLARQQQARSTLRITQNNFKAMIGNYA